MLSQSPSLQVGWKSIQSSTDHCHGWVQDATAVCCALTMSVVPVLIQGWERRMELVSECHLTCPQSLLSALTILEQTSLPSAGFLYSELPVFGGSHISWNS